MSRAAFVRQVMTSKDNLDYDHIACPECGNDQTFILDGYMMIPREEIFENGELKSSKNIKEASAFDIRSIYCLFCQTKSIMQDPIHFNLQKANLQLNEQIRDLTGKDALGHGPIN
jgi:hypothetical protein